MNDFSWAKYYILNHKIIPRKEFETRLKRCLSRGVIGSTEHLCGVVHGIIDYDRYNEIMQTMLNGGTYLCVYLPLGIRDEFKIEPKKETERQNEE